MGYKSCSKTRSLVSAAKNQFEKKKYFWEWSWSKRSLVVLFKWTLWEQGSGLSVSNFVSLTFQLIEIFYIVLSLFWTGSLSLRGRLVFLDWNCFLSLVVSDVGKSSLLLRFADSSFSGESIMFRHLVFRAVLTRLQLPEALQTKRWASNLSAAV